MLVFFHQYPFWITQWRSILQNYLHLQSQKSSFGCSVEPKTQVTSSWPFHSTLSLAIVMFYASLLFVVIITFSNKDAVRLLAFASRFWSFRKVLFVPLPRVSSHVLLIRQPLFAHFLSRFFYFSKPFKFSGLFSNLFSPSRFFLFVFFSFCHKYP